MPPKKPKKAEKAAPVADEKKETDPNAKVSELQRVQYEIQLASLDNKIGRLKTEVDKASSEKDTTELAIDDLRSNKKRVITFLSDQLKRKTEELADLEEKLEGSKQEFELEVADLNLNITDQRDRFAQQKNELELKIEEIKDEINSLIHFQKVRVSIGTEADILAEKVEDQRIRYEERLDQLEEREKADFVRMKKDMIQRVNIAATDFRKTSDQQVPPTIKRAIRENQQVQSALKKMEISCREINQESEQYQHKYDDIMEKKASLYNTELHLAHQSHAKSFIIDKLKAKCKEASTQLRQLELREADIDQKQHVLREMRAKIERNQAIVSELECDINGLMESKADKMRRLEAENAKIEQLKGLLAICGGDILQSGTVTRSTVDKLAAYFAIDGTAVTEDALHTHIEPMAPMSKVEL